MIECFARFVIDQGYGAKAPNNIGTEKEPRYETWHQAGARMFAPEFQEIFTAELLKRNQRRSA